MEANRRSFLKFFGIGATIAPIVNGLVVPSAEAKIIEPPKAQPLILDYTAMGPAERRFQGGTCHVDGRFIRMAFYIDVEKGIVRDMDIAGDSRVYMVHDLLPAHVVDEGKLELRHDGVYFKTLRGKVAVTMPPPIGHC